MIKEKTYMNCGWTQHSGVKTLVIPGEDWSMQTGILILLVVRQSDQVNSKNSKSENESEADGLLISNPRGWLIHSNMLLVLTSIWLRSSNPASTGNQEHEFSHIMLS